MEEQSTMQTSSEHLPKNMVRILKMLTGVDTANATLVAERLNIGRARASGYLNQLERLGFVKRFRRDRNVEFFLVRLPEETRGKERIQEVSLEGITEQLNNARCWLQDVQKSDGGWGEYEGDKSNTINTAESILALLLMGEPRRSNSIDAGRRFINRTLQNLNNRTETSHYIDSELESARSYALMGLALYNTYETVSARDPEDIRMIVSELRRTLDKEGYWDNRSIYSTAIAMRFLDLFADQMIKAEVNRAKNWLLKSFDYQQCGWGRKPGSDFHLSVTARVVSSLNSVGCKDKKLWLARDRLLREADRWSEVAGECWGSYVWRPGNS